MNQKTLRVTATLLLFFVLAFQRVLPARASVENLQLGTVYRVSPNGATSGECGLDWLNPCNLQYALSLATSGAEIWVSSGTYYPDEGAGQVHDDRSSTFQLKEGVAVYGGFSGAETLLSQRNPDPNTNDTILSGDIGTPGVASDNAYHVVEANFLLVAATLDGFTIRGGNADGPLDNFGGGLYNNESDTILRNLIFSGNRTNSGGGGMFSISHDTTRANYNAPTLTNVVFTGNLAERGGGLFTQNNNPILTNVTFSGNTAVSGSGGGMANLTLHVTTDEYSAPVLTNVTFHGNVAKNGGGMSNINSHPVLNNVTFSGNTANVGGGAIHNEGAHPTLKHVTISGNTASTGLGGAIHNVVLESVPSGMTIENSILWGDASGEMVSDDMDDISIVDSVIQGGCPAGASCTNIISTNPVLAELEDNGGFTQTRALLAGSSAINAGGANSICALTDQRGASRPQGSGCDIGAFEAYLLTVTADPQTITYGNTDPAFSFYYNGFVDGDTSSIVDVSPTCGVSGLHSRAGTYAITCSGGADGKYVFFAYVNSTLTVNKATPTLHVINSPSVYTASPLSAEVAGSIPGKVNNILTGGSATQIDVGIYAVMADFTPTDTLNYKSLTGAPAGNFEIVPDVYPPNTFIVSKPLSPSRADVTFTFSSEDATAAFECQLDGIGFSACTSPKKYYKLPSGSHTFEVRARDLFDNVDTTPASYIWFVGANSLKRLESRVITPSSSVTQSGSVNGPITRLWYLEQSGVDDSWGAYANFQTPDVVHVGYHSFYIPGDVQPTLITNALLQINFKVPASSTQAWKWSIYDWKSGVWVNLGNSSGASDGQWQAFIFTIRDISWFVSSKHEIRIQLRSGNSTDDLKLDYEAIHITFYAVEAASPTPVPVNPKR